MKRAMMADRIKLLSDKRAALFSAAHEASRADLAPHWRQEAAKDLEVRAVEYAIACFRYIGGDRG